MRNRKHDGNKSSDVNFGVQGWVTILYCLLMFWLYAGMVNSGSNVTAPAIAEKFGILPGTVLNMNTVAGVVGVIFFIVVGQINRVIGARITSGVCLIVAGLAYLGVGNAVNLAMYTVCMCIVVGGVMSAGYISGGDLVTQWFPKKKGIVMGYTTMGHNLASVAFVPLITLLVGRLGIGNGVIPISVCAIVLGILGLLAKPGAMVASDDEDVESRRADDILASDPVRAYAEQAESLNRRLAALREVELQRTDRHVPDLSVKPLLQVKNLSIQFDTHGDVKVVDNVSFEVRPGQCMALVGESGCGKSITTKVIMSLTDPNETVTGEVLFGDTDLLKLTKDEHRKLLGHEIAMVYQDALSSLNPSMLISTQMKQLTSRGGTRSAEELLELVGLDPKRTLESYPHELSGGQRQRVLIAMALTRDPKLIICDEPTTALDVTVQKQVIKLLNDLQAKLGFAMIFVSHDLALVAEVASEITVMYAGQVIEQAPTTELLTNPIHEYTRGLLGSVLSIEEGAKDGSRLHQVPGSVPSPQDFPRGDRFAPRSSHPTLGLDVHPVIKELPGKNHRFSELPDAYLKENGLTPYLERVAATEQEVM